MSDLHVFRRAAVSFGVQLLGTQTPMVMTAEGVFVCWNTGPDKQTRGSLGPAWGRHMRIFVYYKFENFREVFIYAKFRMCEVSVKIKSSRIGEITLAFTDIGKACPSPEF